MDAPQASAPPEKIEFKKRGDKKVDSICCNNPVQDKKDKKSKKAKKESIGGYSNDQNPWNDAKLTDKFVWKLKENKEDEPEIGEEIRQQEFMVGNFIAKHFQKELEKVKKRRTERELEKKKIEEEKVFKLIFNFFQG